MANVNICDAQFNACKQGIYANTFAGWICNKLFKVYFLWKDLGSPEKDWVVKVSISHISLVPLVGDVVQEVLHVLLVFDMEFTHLYSVGYSRVILQFYWVIIDIKFPPNSNPADLKVGVVEF